MSAVGRTTLASLSGFLAAEAINEYLDVNEWQVAGIGSAIASLDRGKAVAHRDVKGWVAGRGARRWPDRI